MKSNVSFTSKDPAALWLRYGLPLLLVWLFSGSASGDVNDPKDPNIYFPCKFRTITYAAKANAPAGTISNVEFRVDPGSGPAQVFWSGAPSVNCSGSDPTFTCFNNAITVTLPNTSSGPLPKTDPALVSNTLAIPAGPDSGDVKVTVTDAANPATTCDQTYRFHITANGGGWGDPHLTTVDGVHYDFQSAGEFVTLRDEYLEIQTRQTPVATTFLPGANPYTGLAGCVSVYTAVAARVGKHRVSYQPEPGGVPEPSGLQLRVDGERVELGPRGRELEGGGRILNAAGGGIEIEFPDGTRLIVTQGWWASQKTWYLDVNVYDTTASEGLIGRLAKDSWLPALPDGSSLGPKPTDLHDRYVALYEKFANAWRVTDASSLFDYAPGTSTADFTLAEWPREKPSSCDLPAALRTQPPAQPLDLQVADKHCSGIVDANLKANCVFDVRVTGHPGFADTYRLAEQLRPRATRITVKDDKDPTKYGENVTFTATVAQTVSRREDAPTGTVQFILNGNTVGEPVKLESNGQAMWRTSKLKAGKHQVSGKYLPSPGSKFLASTSPEESHTVEWRGK
jgi:hypothetical protein